MSSTYSGNAGNVSLATATSITIPSSGDSRTAASANTPLDKLADYAEAFRLMVAGLGLVAEGFESTTFPPATPSGAWATPSPRFPSDLAWVRSTTNPIAGVASASAPVPQGTTTNSSLGLTVTLTSPSRLSVLFAVNCNANTSDHLDIIIDGVTVAQFSSQTSNTLVGGRYVSDPLREGQHTIDFRFIRGGVASVAAEECKIDTVEIISDETWRADPTRLLFFDEGFVNVNAATAIPANQRVSPPWLFNTQINAGTYGPGVIAGNPSLGVIDLASAAVAAGDWAAMVADINPSSAFPLSPAKTPFVEARFALNGNTVNKIVEVGIGDANAAAGSNSIVWAWDGSNGAASTWRWRGLVAGAATNVDSNVAASGTAYVRLAVMTATVRGVTSAVFTKDGKALPGAASVPPLMATGIPTGPFGAMLRVRSITAAATVQADLDWMRVLALR